MKTSWMKKIRMPPPAAYASDGAELRNIPAGMGRISLQRLSRLFHLLDRRDDVA